jgi:CheY-like chemotaxis protein
MSKRARILIVDDEPINLQVIAGALRRDYDIITAQSGPEALDRLNEQPPDLILLDVMMPVMDGFDVCTRIKAVEAFSDIPVIFLTALDAMSGETRGLEAGGIDYVAKPVNLALLKLRVHNHLVLKERGDLVREQRDALAARTAELEAALERIRRLEGILTICMHCKQVRNDDAMWQQLDQYLSDHTDVRFSHGICPDCLAKHYPRRDDRQREWIMS